MTLSELLVHRNDLLDQAKDEHGFVDEQLILEEMLPHMLDSKLVDSEEINQAYVSQEGLKLNGYAVNETGERLQVFIVDESTIESQVSEDELLISERSHYEAQLSRPIKLVKQAIAGSLSEKFQDSDPLAALINQLSDPVRLEAFDVIEVFLISLTATVSFKGKQPQPKSIHMADGKPFKVVASYDGRQIQRELLIKRRVIDLNFLTSALNSRGRRESLEVRFRDEFPNNIEVIQAADQKHFESFLCVLDADVLFELYRSHGTRLLEKNVRSFLSFRGVNSGIKETIRKEPEKFIAFNNGVTITASAIKVFDYKKKTYLESLTDLQIVNGGQTTATIYFSKREGLDISNVKVMAKINVAKSDSDRELEDLISKISMYSNTQSRVSPVDLRARNPQLVKLKQLSESIQTPEGRHWFFERAKGEFNTMVRKAGTSGARIKAQYPTARRFSKEQLAKYFTAWGDQPHLVKKGGEKVFRYFIEEISGGDGKDETPIDRVFYESLVSKIIIFRCLEKIYGQGKNSMGQLRSAVIPYSMSVVHAYTDGDTKRGNFDLGAIWKSQELESDLAGLFERLMRLMNDLIKKYSESDDFGEFSKKPELWASIKNCSEIQEFYSDSENASVLAKYSA
jgi:hypothetical protein